MRTYPKNDQDWLVAKKLNAEIWMFDALKLNPSSNVAASILKEYQGMNWDLDILNACIDFYFFIERTKEEPMATLSLVLLLNNDLEGIVIRNIQEDDIPVLYRGLAKIAFQMEE